MRKSFQNFILNCTGASAITRKEQIQSLWSGYGEILKLELESSPLNSVIVKLIHGQTKMEHPRGWHGQIGHQRKLRSYQIESKWYQNYAPRAKARLPFCYGQAEVSGKTLLVLEDLDAIGFPIRLERLNNQQLKNCVAWLAQFHADFMHTEPKGLWETGTYWHLETRPQEWEALTDRTLKEAAAGLDQKLKDSPFQTLVHGDAKLANFCFSPGGAVAGLDFQYVGGGCGMKDLAYFVGSCLSEEDCQSEEKTILDFYFRELGKALGKNISELEASWRPLYRVAWADFHRFLKGWSPNHWKINSYSERVTKEVIENL